MQNLLSKRLVIETEKKSPFFYFENKEYIFIYQSYPGYTVYSSVQKKMLENLDSFRMEYLRHAIELLIRPKDKLSLVVRQEA